MPDPLRGNNLISHYNRQHPSSTNNDVHSPVNTHQPSINSPVDNNLEETDIVHLGRKPQDECSLFIETGKRKFKALWDSGAGQCVLSFDCYNAIPARYKSDLFPSLIRIRAANGSIIDNKGECDITFRIGQTNSHSHFLCSNSLSQQFILGHNFSRAFHIGTTWSPDDIMSLTYEGRPIAQTIPTRQINSIVFCCESTTIPPLSNAKVRCTAPKVKSRANPGLNLVFEPSNRHKSHYANCKTYNGLVTFDDQTTRSGSFEIVMTNNSNQYIKVAKNQTLGMLKSCEQEQICTIHRLVTFEDTQIRREGVLPTETKQPSTGKPKGRTVAKDFYQIPTRDKSGEIKILTLLKENVSTVQKITDTTFEDFVSHQKPELQDAPIDHKTKLDLENY